MAYGRQNWRICVPSVCRKWPHEHAPEHRSGWGIHLRAVDGTEPLHLAIGVRLEYPHLVVTAHRWIPPRSGLTSACWRGDGGRSHLTRRGGVCHETGEQTMPLLLLELVIEALEHATARYGRTGESASLVLRFGRVSSGRGILLPLDPGRSVGWEGVTPLS